jgi:hypothetical protein
MKYIVAYTLKNNVTKEFKDKYLVFHDDDINTAFSAAQKCYNTILLEDEIEKGWSLWTANFCIVINTTY